MLSLELPSVKLYAFLWHKQSKLLSKRSAQSQESLIFCPTLTPRDENPSDSDSTALLQAMVLHRSEVMVSVSNMSHVVYLLLICESEHRHIGLHKGVFISNTCLPVCGSACILDLELRLLTAVQ